MHPTPFLSPFLILFISSQILWLFVGWRSKEETLLLQCDFSAIKRRMQNRMTFISSHPEFSPSWSDLNLGTKWENLYKPGTNHWTKGSEAELQLWRPPVRFLSCSLTSTRKEGIMVDLQLIVYSVIRRLFSQYLCFLAVCTFHFKAKQPRQWSLSWRGHAYWSDIQKLPFTEATLLN